MSNFSRTSRLPESLNIFTRLRTPSNVWSSPINSDSEDIWDSMIDGAKQPENFSLLRLMGMLKDPFQKSTEEDLLRQNVILSEIYDFFMTIVKEKRHLNDEQASEVGNSGIYSAKEADKLNLIDQVDSYGKIIESIKNEMGEKSDPVVMKRKIPFLLRFAMKFLGQ